MIIVHTNFSLLTNCNCQSCQRVTLRTLRSLQSGSRAAFTNRSLELGEITYASAFGGLQIKIMADRYNWDRDHQQSLAMRSYPSKLSILTRPVYAPVASPAPPSPATHQSATSSEIVPQLQNIVRFGQTSRTFNKSLHTAR